ncbi:hypothetical protein ACIQ6Y_37120 [Streptomyces sp. NPDC096205]|uniref:hypothetical protein n=1 Tax=Streptomyces sp. NPDC096205 TaxID=3366081 RepID=UPI00381FECAC
MRNRIVLAAAAVLAVGASVLSPHPAAQAAAPHAVRAGTVLACDGHTAPGAPVTIQPALSSREKSTTVRGKLLLDRCVSPNGSVRGIRSGVVTFNLSGKASCTTARDVSGGGRVTWYSSGDRTGRPTGTSVLDSRGPRSWAPGAALPTIVVRSGTLAGRTITAGPVGMPRMLKCSTRGIGSLSGAFWARAS